VKEAVQSDFKACVLENESLEKVSGKINRNCGLNLQLKSGTDTTEVHSLLRPSVITLTAKYWLLD